MPHLLEVTVLIALAAASLATVFFARRASTDSSKEARVKIIAGFALLGIAAIARLILADSDLEKIRWAFRAEQLFQVVAIVGAVHLMLGFWDFACIRLQSDLTSRFGARGEKVLIPVTRKLVQFIVLAFGVLGGLWVFGVNVAGLMAGLGIGGLVVALAAKDSVENLFGSITILFDMPFGLGDWVKIDKIEGVVEEINLRSTRIRTFEDSVITLPNSNLIKASVENFGARRARRQRFFIKVDHATPTERIEAFCDGMRERLRAIPKVQSEKLYVNVHEYEELTLNILVQCFFNVDSADEEFAMRHELMLQVDAERMEHGLLPAPIR